MRILITNDDGAGAHGLTVLHQIAKALTDDVWIVAPEMNQSGASHSLTLQVPLRYREIGERAFAVRGTDAVDVPGYEFQHDAGGLSMLRGFGAIVPRRAP